MKPGSVADVLLTFPNGILGALAASARNEAHATRSSSSASAVSARKPMSYDDMWTSAEPQDALAMAYHNSVGTFATALHQQATRSGPIPVVFARHAAAEMRRSFDRMKDHHNAHMKTMSAETHTRMAEMRKQTEMRQGDLDGQIAALEQEVRSSTPDTGKLAKLAAAVKINLAAIAKMKADGTGTKMTL